MTSPGAPVICHVLLVETDNGLVLVDSGFGLQDCRDPSRIGPARHLIRPIFDVGETAVRQVEALVSGHRPGDRPGDPPSEEARRHVLRFEVTGETYALFREAAAKTRRDAGEPIDEEAVLRLMSRQVLGGPRDEGRASYQISLTVCESCGGAWQEGRGELVPVEKETLEMAACDAQEVGPVQGARAPASQKIPPAVRRQVMHRDHGRCRVPGCRHSLYCDVHHVVTRQEGGGHDPDGLLVVCEAHHRAVHEGMIVIEGRVSTGLNFWHADGTEYGQTVTPAAAAAFSDAFLALRYLEFKDGEAKRALAQVRAHVGRETDVGEIVKHALRVLRPAA